MRLGLRETIHLPHGVPLRLRSDLSRTYPMLRPYARSWLPQLCPAWSPWGIANTEEAV